MAGRSRHEEIERLAHENQRLARQLTAALEEATMRLNMFSRRAAPQTVIDSEQQKAIRRAENLFLSRLTPEQAASHKKNGYIETRGARFPWRIYTTARPPGFAPVVLLDDHGKVRGSFCGYFRTGTMMGLPPGDVWLSYKYTVELTEDEWLRIANPYDFDGDVPPKARLLRGLPAFK